MSLFAPIETVSLFESVSIRVSLYRDLTVLSHSVKGKEYNCTANLLVIVLDITWLSSFLDAEIL